ncbi:hypothetical protein [Ralstonia sp.]
MKLRDAGDRVCVVLLILVIAVGVFAFASIVGSMPWPAFGRTN